MSYVNPDPYNISINLIDPGFTASDSSIDVSVGTDVLSEIISVSTISFLSSSIIYVDNHIESSSSISLTSSISKERFGDINLTSRCSLFITAEEISLRTISSVITIPTVTLDFEIDLTISSSNVSISPSIIKTINSFSLILSYSSVQIKEYAEKLAKFGTIGLESSIDIDPYVTTSVHLSNSSSLSIDFYYVKVLESFIESTFSINIDSIKESYNSSSFLTESLIYVRSFVNVGIFLDSPSAEIEINPFLESSIVLHLSSSANISVSNKVSKDLDRSFSVGGLTEEQSTELISYSSKSSSFSGIRSSGLKFNSTKDLSLTSRNGTNRSFSVYGVLKEGTFSKISASVERVKELTNDIYFSSKDTSKADFNVRAYQSLSLEKDLSLLIKTVSEDNINYSSRHGDNTSLNVVGFKKFDTSVGFSTICAPVSSCDNFKSFIEKSLGETLTWETDMVVFTELMTFIQNDIYQLTKNFTKVRDIDAVADHFIKYLQREISLFLPESDLLDPVEFIKEAKSWYSGKGTLLSYKYIAALTNVDINIWEPSKLIMRTNSPNTLVDGAIHKDNESGESKLGRIRDGVYWSFYTYVIEIRPFDTLDIDDFLGFLNLVHPAGTKFFLTIKLESVIESDHFSVDIDDHYKIIHYEPILVTNSRCLLDYDLMTDGECELDGRGRLVETVIPYYTSYSLNSRDAGEFDAITTLSSSTLLNKKESRIDFGVILDDSSLDSSIDIERVIPITTEYFTMNSESELLVNKITILDDEFVTLANDNLDSSMVSDLSELDGRDRIVSSDRLETVEFEEFSSYVPSSGSPLLDYSLLLDETESNFGARISTVTPIGQSSSLYENTGFVSNVETDISIQTNLYVKDYFSNNINTPDFGVLDGRIITDIVIPIETITSDSISSSSITITLEEKFIFYEYMEIRNVYTLDSDLILDSSILDSNNILNSTFDKLVNQPIPLTVINEFSYNEINKSDVRVLDGTISSTSVIPIESVVSDFISSNQSDVTIDDRYYFYEYIKLGNLQHFDNDLMLDNSSIFDSNNIITSNYSTYTI